MLAGSTPLHADTVRLEDGNEVSGNVLRIEGDSITVALPRKNVATINGRPLPPPVTAGQPAPAFSVPDMAGVAQAVPDPQAVVVLQFWATWCPHCRSDVEMLTKLSERKGVRVVSVSVDQDLKALQEFVRGRKVPYPVIAAYSQEASEAAEIPARYEAEGIPAYYIIDRKGVIAHRLSGSVTEARKDLEGLLKPLLAAER